MNKSIKTINDNNLTSNTPIIVKLNTDNYSFYWVFDYKTGLIKTKHQSLVLLNLIINMKKLMKIKNFQ